MSESIQLPTAAQLSLTRFHIYNFENIRTQFPFNNSRFTPYLFVSFTQFSFHFSSLFSPSLNTHTYLQYKIQCVTICVRERMFSSTFASMLPRQLPFHLLFSSGLCSIFFFFYFILSSIYLFVFFYSQLEKENKAKVWDVYVRIQFLIPREAQMRSFIIQYFFFYTLLHIIIFMLLFFSSSSSSIIRVYICKYSFVFFVFFFSFQFLLL